MIAALLLAAACIAGPAPVHTASGTVSYDGPPPARYSHLGTYTVTVTTQARINRICGLAPCPLHTVACTVDGHLYLPDPASTSAADFRDTFQHEWGHAAGWPADHPQ